MGIISGNADHSRASWGSGLISFGVRLPHPLPKTVCRYSVLCVCVCVLASVSLVRYYTLFLSINAGIDVPLHTHTLASFYQFFTKVLETFFSPPIRSMTWLVCFLVFWQLTVRKRVFFCCDGESMTFDWSKKKKETA